MIEYFFDLTHFAHAALWSYREPVWSALMNLSEYIKSYPLGQIETKIPEGVFIADRNLISIGKGTVIEPGAFIQGPCILGNNCHISHGAYLRGGVICGDRCHVGHSAEIKRSILLNDAKATHFVYVGDSILGNDINLGAGVKCANLRLDRRSIRISYRNECFDTPLRKMGVILGDFSQIGCNSVINPGTLLEKRTVALPLSLLGNQKKEEAHADPSPKD